MIFKHLFTPKHRHPNEAVRAKAIETLSIDDPKQKSELHELAFNDASHHVRYKALLKLDNFALWWKVVQTDKDEFIRKKASEIVESGLVNDTSTDLTTEQKTFLLESSNKNLLEKVFQQRLIGSSDTEFVLASLDKLAKPQWTRRVILANSDSSLAETLLEKITDETELAKLARKLNEGALLHKVNQKIASIKDENERPMKLAKEVRLILSKLLALKDEKDFAVLSEQKSQLVDEFQHCTSQFDCLATELKTEFEQKYASILAKLVELQNEMEASWQEAQHRLDAALQVDDVEKQIDVLNNTISTCMNNGVEQVTIEQVAQFKVMHAQLTDALQKVNKSYLNPAEVKRTESLFNRLNAGQVTLDRLPNFQHALQKGQDTLQGFEAKAIPEGANAIEQIRQSIKDMREQWWEVKNGFADVWPSDAQSRFDSIIKNWQTASSKLLGEQKETITKCRGKLNFVQKLIDEGKYRKAMGVYQTAATLFAETDATARLKLERQYLKVKEQVENLQDWQDYLASPRRPALLKQIEELAENPLPVDEQASQVKLLRQQWNSLGRLTQDDGQEIEFNRLSELAFAPCREHYTRQQQERQANLEAKHAIIAQFVQLNDTQNAIDQMSDQYRWLVKQWKAIGQVDYQHLDSLNDQFQTSIAPIKEKINAYQHANMEQKQALINKVESLDLSDLAHAVEQAKQCQETWKTIGFAGSKEDRALWLRFRKANDKVFALRQAQYDEAKQALNGLIDNIEKGLTQLEPLLYSFEAAPQSELEAQFADIASEITLAIKQLDAKLQSKWFKQLENKQQQFTQLLNAQRQRIQKQSYVALFDCLESWTSDQRPDAVSQLPSRRQTWFVQQSEEADSRQILTIKLEIVSERSSPKCDEELRKEIQLGLMANKLTHGETLDKEQLLAQWISHGPVKRDEVSLLDRVKSVFI